MTTAVDKENNGYFDRRLEVLDWGLLTYGEAFQRQLELVDARIAGDAPDRLVLVEHPPVVTIGRSGEAEDLRITEDALRAKGIELCRVDRGGRATYHGPGQLVIYPIIKLQSNDLHDYIQRLQRVVGAVIRTWGLNPVMQPGQPGMWIGSEKIASVGIAVRKWVTYHGVALNVNSDVDAFRWIRPCGHPYATITSLHRELGRPVDLNAVKTKIVKAFITHFGYPVGTAETATLSKHPRWLNRPAPDPSVIAHMEQRLAHLQVATVCQTAHCPNLGECFQKKTATFMILGTCCTRTCRFCAVDKGQPAGVDRKEPQRVAQAARKLGLRHIVMTSVTRDDLRDGGADQFVRTIQAVRERCPGAALEVLVPDFRGSLTAIQKVCDTRPEMLNHNIETVPRLYAAVRPGADYRRSLGLLEYAARQGLPVKSGLMLGLGETRYEVEAVLSDLRRTGCRYVTLGQYLAPSRRHVPVVQYVSPPEFKDWAATARAMGFSGVAAGPLVRSSYRADELLQTSNSDQPMRQFYQAEASNDQTAATIYC
jgi:lipoic acid synthetase